ncbi:MAG: hypothetical protein P4L39_03905 [Humidesulfovibrio sp.]|nr:hypothetical protein [Humidesulfovibrio sp.]
MRRSRNLARQVLAQALCLAVGLTLPLLFAPCPGLAKKAAVQAQEPAKGEPVEISGRVAVGLDKVFIKDAQGYCLVRGLDLTPYAGRHIQAKGLVIHKDQEYRTVRLLEYRILSPDDDSPGAGGEIRQTSVTGKKKK